MDQMSRRTVDLDDEQWVREWIAWFGAHRPKYQKLAANLEKVLQAAARRYAPLAIVQSRAKTVSGYAEKLQRKLTRYRMVDSEGRLLHPVTDLCGARVITHTPTEVKKICRFIEEHFQIDSDNSVDVSTRLKTNEFGYLSVHYVARFRPGVFPTKTVPVNVSQGLCRMDVEIQVRTLLEHAWSAISHDLSYKGTFRLPERWEREFARLAAILEDADQAFCRVESGLAEYASNYGAYMSEKRMHAEIAKAELVLQVVPGDVEVAHRIARLAMCLGDWEKVVEVLEPLVSLESAPMLRDLGVAMCKLHKKRSRGFRRGQKYLEGAITLDPTDSDAIASLGGTWRGLDEDEALRRYRQAFEVNPSDPYPLGNYLESAIAKRKDLAPVQFAMGSLRVALRKCRNQADVGMNMPWAFYDMGKFHLLLKEPYKSLNMYAKAVDVSTSKGMIRSSLDSVNRLEVSAEEIPGAEWVRKFLAMAISATFERGKLPRWLSSPAVSKRRTLKGPIIILTGGCEKMTSRQALRYSRLMRQAFRDFRGTVIGDGTNVGSGRLVGDIGATYRGQIRTIGYLPRNASADRSRRRCHEIRRTPAGDLSPLALLSAWVDVLASGIPLSHVRLLGVGGDHIASAEYRMALALGAKVGLLSDSGGAVSELLADDDWRDSEDLVPLPADPMTVRAFVGPGEFVLPTDIRNTIAETIHELYRRNQASRLRSDDPSMVNWEDLTNGLKESNRKQADHILEKLDVLGYTVRKARKRSPKAITKFSDREVRIMAEMEHGRWNLERLLSGWRLGEKKDIENKVSPYLVPWDELPEEVKEWDRQTVRGIPGFLARIGLQIARQR